MRPKKKNESKSAASQKQSLRKYAKVLFRMVKLERDKPRIAEYKRLYLLLQRAYRIIYVLINLQNILVIFFSSAV